MLQLLDPLLGRLWSLLQDPVSSQLIFGFFFDFVIYFCWIDIETTGYAAFCGSCLAAEISADYLQAKGCCGSDSCCAQWWCACLLSCLISTVGSFLCGAGSLMSPWVYTIWFAQGRDAIKLKYNLPHDELCCDNSVTTFLPSYICCLNCDVCALFQQAYFLKHTMKEHDFTCCCYQCMCTSCKPQEDAGAVQMTSA